MISLSINENFICNHDLNNGCCLDVEMPALVCLGHMELNGFGFSEDECERQRKIIVARLEELEQEAYRLAGRTFALTSPEDVCQVRN